MDDRSRAEMDDAYEEADQAEYAEFMAELDARDARLTELYDDTTEETPMTDTTPAQLADGAAEAIRALNHATLRPGDGRDWEYVGDAYDVVGHLVAMAERLPQALTQVMRHIEQLHGRGQIGSDRTTNPRADVAAVIGGLSAAVEGVEALRGDLADAHTALAVLHHKD